MATEWNVVVSKREGRETLIRVMDGTRCVYERTAPSKVFDERLAEAQLIASAPAMLASLKSARTVFAGGDVTDVQAHAMSLNLSAVIDQATTNAG